MTPNQLPPLPEPDTHCFDDDTGKDVWSYSSDQMHAYALAALAQQAQEPVAWLYVDTVGERYLCFSRPTGGGAITNLYTTPPAPQVPVPVVSEDDLVACLISSGCVGTVKMSFESGPMSITRPSLNATKFARAILALRPAVEPMTPEQINEMALQEEFLLVCDGVEELAEIVRAIERHHGITAKAEGGA